jgi:alpha-galactosidase
MNAYSSIRTVAVVLGLVFGAVTSGWTAEVVQPREMLDRERWVQQHLSEGAPPFSFVFDGKASGDLLATWPKKVAMKALDAARSQRTVTWTDAASGLVVCCVSVEYADFPAVEWTVYFKNVGSKNTPILKDIRGLDVRIERPEGDEFVLRGIKGDTGGPDLYEPYEFTLAPSTSKTFVPAGGRPTNGAFPYYSLAMPGGGLFLAVGWPGQWSSMFVRDAGTGLQISAGQELTHLSLKPGEEIRSPLIALLFWKGSDVERSQNLWRRWMIAHNVPRVAGGKLPTPIILGNSSIEFNEMCDTNEEIQKHFIDRYAEEGVKIDYWWMDAGWYPCNGWPQTGTWEPDPKRFPNGLRAISDYARTKGVKTLVWFEPERVAGGTWISQNHPEWLLGGTLLNLGDPKARQWLTDHVDRVLREQGIDLYRQDFNIDPLDFWRKNDSPDRQGMTENLHVQGYLAYWDALRQRHPGMMIDSCASGGRRNDLETMRRAVPLHSTDYNYADLPVKQAFHHSLFQWIPYFGANTWPWETITPYAVRSAHAMSIMLPYDMRRKGLDYAALRKLVEESRAVTSHFYGDFYPLTPYSRTEDKWIAWQFDRPERGNGVVEVFRRAKCSEGQVMLRLKGLEPDAYYAIVNRDVGTPIQVSGKDLMTQGRLVTIPQNPGAAVLLYWKTKARD